MHVESTNLSAIEKDYFKETTKSCSLEEYYMYFYLQLYRDSKNVSADCFWDDNVY